MTRHRPFILLASLVTLGSGLLNLYSVIGPALPKREVLLQEIFPLEFIHLSRFFTLLIGFALVISSINIYKRKKRALQLVFVLASFSILFHLTKGLDYEQAAFSGVLLILLWLSRKYFTVKSSTPDWRSGLVRLAVAMLVALGYGVAGFWLLDPREFGTNFTIGESIHRTLLFLSLVGDPGVVPHTRYAQWFVDSLYLITVTAIVYSGFALFRPALYHLRTHPQESALAKQIIAQHGRTAIDFFKSWPDKSYFFFPDHQCFLAYSVGASFAVVLGDPVGPEERIEDIVHRFEEFCQDQDWGFGFYQTLPDFLPIYKRLGLKKLKIGDDGIVDLATFTLDGKVMKPARNAVTKLEKAGLRVRQYNPPVPDEVLGELEEVSNEWLKIPGRRERRFSLGRFDPEFLRSTPVAVALDRDGKVLAFANAVPSPRRGELAVDLMRRRIDAPNGVMEYLFVKLFLFKKKEGFERFNLGMAPASGFQEKEHASPQERAVQSFFQQLNFVFSYRGLRAYKAKFASSWEPRYVVYRNVLDLPRLAIALGRVSDVKE